MVAELDTTPAALALAWVARNPNTSTVILGASNPQQVLDNLKALEVIPKLTPEILGKIEHILGNTPKPVVCFPLCAPLNTQFYIPFIFHSALTQGRAWINLPNSSVQDKWT